MNLVMNILKKNTFYGILVRYKSVMSTMKIDKMASIFPCDDVSSYVKAAEYLEKGEVIAVPTDTIYGLACSAKCPEAIKKLYTIKGRDSIKPVAICVNSILDVRHWGDASHLSDILLNNLLPGPVTVVLEKTKYLDNPYLNPQTTKIGIRIPNNVFINNMTNVFNKPVALTSANFSNEPSTLCIEEFKHLYEHLGAVFDGGTLSRGLNANRIGSTIVDLSVKGEYNIIRKGISYERIVEFLNSYGLRGAVK